MEDPVIVIVDVIWQSNKSSIKRVKYTYRKSPITCSLGNNSGFVRFDQSGHSYYECTPELIHFIHEFEYWFYKVL